MNHIRTFSSILALLTVLAVLPASTHAEDIVLKCRVVDTDGNPVEGATAFVRTLAERDNSGNAQLRESFQPLPPSAPDGIVTTLVLQSGRSYAIEFSKEGFAPQFSRRSHPEDSGTIELPDVVLRRLRTVHGQVVNADGSALSGVVIHQAGDGPARTETKSAGDGAFHLDGVPEGFALLFATLDGYWFRGVRAPKNNDALTIVLTPRSQPNPDQCDTESMSPRNPAESDVAVNEEAIEGLANDIRAAAADGRRAIMVNLWHHLSSLDQQRAVSLIDELKLPDDQRTSLLQPLVLGEMRDDFTNGMARLMQFDKSEDRLTAIVYHLLPDGEVFGKHGPQLLALAVTDLRALQDPMQRASFLSQLLKFFDRQNDKETISELIAAAVESLDRAGDAPAVQAAFGSLAEAVAPIDADRALKLLARSPGTYRAWVAFGIAKEFPKQAAELIRNYEFSETGGSRLGRWYNLPRVCYQIALSDVDEALAVADLSAGIVEERVRFKPYSLAVSSREPTNLLTSAASELTEQLADRLPNNVDPASDAVAILLRARIHAAIAQAAAETSPDRAREILNAAVRDIESVNAGVRNLAVGFLYPPSLFMASLIPAAAKFDSGLAAELCWRSLALRPPALGVDIRDAEARDIAELQVINFVATMDPALAIDLLRPVNNLQAKRSFDGLPDGYSRWCVCSWRIVSEADGREWLRSVCDRGVADARSPRKSLQQLWTTLARVNVTIDSWTVMDQAELWMNSVLWTQAITRAE